MTLDELLKTGWDEHADHPQEVADRLAVSIHLVQKPADIRPFAGLLAHVCGEHLGRWQDGIALLQQVRRAPGFDASAAAEQPLVRWIASLQFAGGDATALEPLSTEDRVIVLANASAMLAGQQQLRRAIDTYNQALRLAQPGLPAGSPAIRSLAIGGNNLATALESQATLDAFERQGMVAAAQGGLTYWKQAGTWLEEERAEYRLSRSLQKAGRFAAAIQAAQRCLDICQRHAAPAFEMFFAHAVLAMAHRHADDGAAFASHREQALAAHAQLPDDEKPWCEDGLAELG